MMKHQVATAAWAELKNRALGLQFRSWLSRGSDPSVPEVEIPVVVGAQEPPHDQSHNRKSNGDGQERPHVRKTRRRFQAAVLPFSQPGVEFFCVLLFECAHGVPNFKELD